MWRGEEQRRRSKTDEEKKGQNRIIAETIPQPEPTTEEKPNPGTSRINPEPQRKGKERKGKE